MDLRLMQKSILILLSTVHGLTGFNLSTTQNGSTEASESTVPPLATTSFSNLRFKSEGIGNVTKYEVRVGDSVLFDCDAEEEAPLPVKWEKYGEPLEQACYRFESFVRYSSHHLRLNHVLPADSGNYTCIVAKKLRRSFILEVLEKKEPSKPKILEFSPRNLSVIVGKSIRMQCLAGGTVNSSPPFLKLVRYKRMLTGANTTDSVNLTQWLNMEIMQIVTRGRSIPYLNQNYETIEDEVSVTVVETVVLERSLAVEFAVDQVGYDDGGTYACIAFNTAGYTKETMHLNVIPPPKATIYELAVAYASKFDGKDSRPKIPLSVSIGLPVTVFVVLTIGFIWWKENVRIKSREERLSFIKIKNLRELDNFSSLEHMEKFSSRMETKPPSFVSDVNVSAAVDEFDHDQINSHDREHDCLLGNGHTISAPKQRHSKTESPKAPEMIPLHDMGAAVSETPVTARSSAFGSYSELEWEPVDLKLNIPIKGELSQILDTSA